MNTLRSSNEDVTSHLGNNSIIFRKSSPHFFALNHQLLQILLSVVKVVFVFPAVVTSEGALQLDREKEKHG
jgi:hypothetical protein